MHQNFYTREEAYSNKAYRSNLTYFCKISKRKRKVYSSVRVNKLFNHELMLADLKVEKGISRGVLLRNSKKLAWVLKIPKRCFKRIANFTGYSAIEVMESFFKKGYFVSLKKNYGCYGIFHATFFEQKELSPLF